MVYKLGMSSSNLGCDRAQCGACTVVDRRPRLNGCTVISARLGRGQKIITVDGIRSGPGAAACTRFRRRSGWFGGYQCGICTRGFIMSTYALLETNKSPTQDELPRHCAGNICRCSEYPQIFASVQAAAAELRGEKMIELGAAGGGGGELEPIRPRPSREEGRTWQLTSTLCGSRTTSDYAATLNDAQWQAACQLTPIGTSVGPKTWTFWSRSWPRSARSWATSSAASNGPPRPIPQGPFEVIGKGFPRMHGFGHVTGFGQFTEHKTEPGMLFMREAA